MEKECQQTIFKGIGDIMNCGMHRGVTSPEHAMKLLKKYLRKYL